MKMKSGLWLVAGSLVVLSGCSEPSHKNEYDITVDQILMNNGEFLKEGIGYNGTSPGPLIRLKQGEDATINVTNNLDSDVTTSIHWHGVVVPYQMDGVPFMSFPPIKPGDTFTYTFPVKDSGTYFYHSHSGQQHTSGAVGPIVVEPKDEDPYEYDREYIVQISDAHPDNGEVIMKNLKKNPAHYNRPDLATESMPMPRASVEEFQGYVGTINGKGPGQNWFGKFSPGERVRLRFINSASMSSFDVRIPGLKMTVVQADGNNVKPVEVDELRIGVAEIYDVIVEPEEQKAYTIFAESMGRTFYARGTLAPNEDLKVKAKVPELRRSESTASKNARDPFYVDDDPITPVAANGGKFLSYADLEAAEPKYEYREPDREIEIRLTGSKEHPYQWDMTGEGFQDGKNLRLKYGERVRLKYVNETASVHPMHLHGMWQILDVGKGPLNPAKHTINVPPGATVYADVEVDATGVWVYHCHMSYHASTGMYRAVIIEGGPEGSEAQKEYERRTKGAPSMGH